MDCIELSMACFTSAASKLRLWMLTIFLNRGALPTKSRLQPASLAICCPLGCSPTCIIPHNTISMELKR